MIQTFNKALEYGEKGDFARAEKYYKKCLKSQPGWAEAHLNLGACYKETGRLRDALREFKIALVLQPNWSLPNNNIGLIYHNWNQEDIASEYFRTAIKLDPSYGDAHWNLGLSLLKRDCSSKEGWDEYEWRFKKSGPVRLCLNSTLPLWDGVSTGRVLVIPEQGLGDFVMFAGYLTSSMTFYAGENIVDLATALGIPLASDESGFDYYIPMGSLPRYCEYTPRDYGTKRIGGGGAGVVWKGSASHGNDKNRSLFENQLAFVGAATSLQFGVKSTKFKNIDCKNWKDTISALLQLDYLVSVDTSIVHVAGALGIPTICLVPSIDTDFRWGLTGSDNLWYRSVTIARSLKEVETYVNRIKA